VLEARGRVAAWDPERLRVELEAAGLLRAEAAFELRPADPAFELLRAAEFELLRAAEFELLRAAEFELLRAAEFELLRAEPELELRRLELAAVAPLPLAAGRLRLLAFADPLCFVLVCLATSRPLYGRCDEAHVHATSIAVGPHIGGASDRRVPPLGSDGRRSRIRLAGELRPGGAGDLIVIENRGAGEPVVPATPLGGQEDREEAEADGEERERDRH
jgi:hypothetical protein